MSKFKVGDRVRVYISEKGNQGLKGTVSHNYGCGDVEVKLDEGCLDLVHEKQRRKLKPKRKPREFWINIHTDGWLDAYRTEDGAEFWKKPNLVDRVHVIEVLDKKAKK